MRKFYKTVFRIEVLSEDSPIEGVSLETLAYLISDGDCSGEFSTEEIIELSPKEAAKELINQGSDPEFFRLTEDGNEMRDDGWEVGANCYVPDPENNDDWSHGFEGTIIDITEGFATQEDYATVEDMEGNCWDVDMSRLEEV